MTTLHQPHIPTDITIPHILPSPQFRSTSTLHLSSMECARLLVEYPRWTVSGTFKPCPGDLAETSDHIPLPWARLATRVHSYRGTVPFFYTYAMLTGTWANQTILSSQFLLPESPIKPIYYMALLIELGKLSLQTVGPALESAPCRPHSRTGT